MSLKDISNFSVLLFIFMFTYTLLGMELFAYSVKVDPDTDKIVNFEDTGVYPMHNFNTFLQSFVTIFIIVIGEDWNNVMY